MSKLKLLLKLVLVFSLVFMLSFGLGASLHNLLLADDDPTEEQEPTVIDGERTNILLLGTDARPGETHTRTDTIILASIDPELNKMALVSIPRDTRVTIKGSTDKINSANAVGGPELVADKVEEIVGEKIDYYVEMDFAGFKKIIDTIGGVDINVDQRMYKPSEDIDLQPGQQRLKGSQALAFVRFRDYALGDIERTEHQQIFLKALGDELLQAKNIVKLPALVKVVKQNIDTNLGMTDMLKMASWAPGFSSDSIIAQTLPGYFWDQRDEYGNLTMSYWVADQDKTEDLLEKMLAGQTVAVVSDSPVAYNPGNQSSVKDKNKDKDDSESEAEQTIEELNWERSRLPSAGHGVKNKV
ncbi:MAG TPA: LCP family protein [Syntrophomonas sp.]|nr:LCP family protein [Syntrophomonas sp.]